MFPHTIKRNVCEHKQPFRGHYQRGEHLGIGQLKHWNLFIPHLIKQITRSTFVSLYLPWDVWPSTTELIKSEILIMGCISDGTLGFNPKQNQPSCSPIRHHTVDIQCFTECVPANCHHCVIWWSRRPFTKWTGTWLIPQQSCFTTHTAIHCIFKVDCQGWCLWDHISC